MAAPTIPACSFCGNTLSPHERIKGTCHRAACREQALKQHYADKAKEKQDRMNEACTLRDRVADLLDQPALKERPPLLLPSNHRALSTLPEKRMRRFRDLLTAKISQAYQQEIRGDEAEPEPEAYPGGAVENPDSQRRIGLACSSCRGHCCFQGGEHAFLSVPVLRRFFRDRPGMRPRQALAAYLEHLGGKTYQDSCLYHGRKGCRLPREMRSRICNEYLCSGVLKLNARGEAQPGEALFVAPGREGRIVRTGIIDSDGLREFDTEQPGD